MSGRTLWDELRSAGFPVPGRDPDWEDTLRIGDAERNRVTEALHEHYAQGRLTREELDERLDATLAAKTFADLRPITADLPDLSRHTPEPTRRRPAVESLRGSFAVPLAFVAVPLGIVVTMVLLLAVLRAALFLLPIMAIAWLVIAILGVGRHHRWHGVHPGDFAAFQRHTGWHSHRYGRRLGNRPPYGQYPGDRYGHWFGR